MPALKSLVPLPIKIEGHSLAHNVSSLARDISFWPDRLSHRLRGTPVPSGKLIYLVAQHRSPDVFIRSGEVSKQQIRDILKRNGVELERCKAILDFGCGVGRVIRHWKSMNGPEVHGTDYNPILIEWCRRHLPFAQFQCNTLAAKLEHEDGKFDFIYALSVFTHLPEELARAWLHELYRVMRPGGYLYVTTHGAHYFSTRSPAEQAKLAQGELVVVATDRAGSNACAVFHPESYVREHWTNLFRVVDFRPGRAGMASEQDAWLLQKTLIQ